MANLDNQEIPPSLDDGAVRVLLILNKGFEYDIKVLVKIHAKPLINQLKTLIAESREKEAFDLAYSRGEVVQYIPAGRRIRVKPEYTFVEDIL